MAKKIIVDQDLCVGCGACASLFPDVFELQDNGKVKVISNDDCDCNGAESSCPVGAIKIEK